MFSVGMHLKLNCSVFTFQNIYCVKNAAVFTITADDMYWLHNSTSVTLDKPMHIFSQCSCSCCVCVEGVKKCNHAIQTLMELVCYLYSAYLITSVEAKNIMQHCIHLSIRLIRIQFNNTNCLVWNKRYTFHQLFFFSNNGSHNNKK